MYQNMLYITSENQFPKWPAKENQVNMTSRSQCIIRRNSIYTIEENKNDFGDDHKMQVE